jgi:hypothetical protein
MDRPYSRFCWLCRKNWRRSVWWRTAMPRMPLPKLWKAAMRPRAGSGKRSLPKRLGSGRKHYSRAGSGRMRSEASRGHWPGGTSIGNRARRRLDRRRSRMTEGPSRRVGVDVRPKPVRDAMLDGLRQAGLPALYTGDYAIGVAGPCISPESVVEGNRDAAHKSPNHLQRIRCIVPRTVHLLDRPDLQHIIAAGLNSVAASPSASPIHTGQSCGSKITGIWPCIHQQSRSRAL